MDPIEEFEIERAENIKNLGANDKMKKIGPDFISATAPYKYSYNFSWMGRPVIQFPQDMIAMHEIIWQVKPDLIIETGIAHGGSIIMYASFLEMIGHGHVLGIDIDIREHNRKEIEQHPMFSRISMLEGSSISDEIVAKTIAYAKKYQNIMVVLDSNHTHDHVRKELQLYAPLVTNGSYLIVFDTIIEDMPADAFPNRPWGKGNNPKTAVLDFLKNNDRFVVDKQMENKLLITVAPGGFLKCVKDTDH